MSPSKSSKMKSKQNKQVSVQIIKILIHNSCDTISQTHRRLESYNKQTN